MLPPHPYLRPGPFLRTREGRGIFIGLAVLHAGLLLGIVLFALGIVPPRDLALHAALYTLSGLGVAAGYHRLMTHRSFEAHPVLRLVLLIGGSVAMMGPVLLWVATHVEHHRNADRPGDPHSARPDGPGLWAHLRAFLHAHLGWMLGSQARMHLKKYLRSHLKDPNRLSRDPIVRFMNRTSLYWAVAGFAVPVVWGIGFGGWGGAVANLLQSAIRACLLLHVVWLVNSLGHMVGERAFHTGDLSTNWWDPLLLIASFGELLHNNHHAFQNRAYYGLKWWQIDLAGLSILLWRSLRLASRVRLVTREEMLRKRRAVSAPA